MKTRTMQKEMEGKQRHRLRDVPLQYLDAYAPSITSRAIWNWECDRMEQSRERESGETEGGDRYVDDGLLLCVCYVNRSLVTDPLCCIGQLCYTNSTLRMHVAWLWIHIRRIQAMQDGVQRISQLVVKYLTVYSDLWLCNAFSSIELSRVSWKFQAVCSATRYSFFYCYLDRIDK